LNGIGSHLEYTNNVSIDSKIIEIVHAILVYICMDRDWINLYENGVEEFIQFVQRYEGKSDE